MPKYDYFDKDTVIVRTPHSADPLECGYDGFERYEKNGWEPWPVGWSYVMEAACPITEAQAEKHMATLDRYWHAKASSEETASPAQAGDLGDGSSGDPAA